MTRRDFLAACLSILAAPLSLGPSAAWPAENAIKEIVSENGSYLPGPSFVINGKSEEIWIAHGSNDYRSSEVTLG